MNNQETGAVPLVTYDPEQKTFVINDYGCEQLERWNEPLAVVIVAGRYRSGKSFLMNQLVQQLSSQSEKSSSRATFSVGHTVQSHTKGIWVCDETFVVDGNEGSNKPVRMIVMDSEGLGSTDQTEQYDTTIFSLATLLCSTLVFNGSSTIDESSIQSLGFIANLSQHIRIQSSDSNQNEDNAGEYFQRFFPSFLWVLRDFSLGLFDEDGYEISSDEYMEQSLAEQPGFDADTMARNRIRRSIRTFFRNRRCATLVRPSDDETALQKLDNANENMIRPEFREGIQQLVHVLLKQSQPKRIGSQLITGPLLVKLLRNYITAINGGSIPCIADAWTEATSQACEEYAHRAMQMYLYHMRPTLHSNATKECTDIDLSSLQTNNNLPENKKKEVEIVLPCASETLLEVHQLCRNNALETFRQGVPSGTNATQLEYHLTSIETKIAEYFQRLSVMNNSISLQYCRQLLRRILHVTLQPLVDEAHLVAERSRQSLRSKRDVLTNTNESVPSDMNDESCSQEEAGLETLRGLIDVPQNDHTTKVAMDNKHSPTAQSTVEPTQAQFWLQKFCNAWSNATQMYKQEAAGPQSDKVFSESAFSIWSDCIQDVLQSIDGCTEELEETYRAQSQSALAYASNFFTALQSSRHELSGQKALLVEKESALEEALQRATAVSSQRDKYKDELSATNAKLDDWKHQHVSLQDTLKQRDDQLKRDQEEINELRTALKDAQEKIQSSNQREVDSDHKIDSLMAEIKEVTARCTQLEEEKTVAQDMTKAKSELLQTTEHELRELRKANERLKTQFEQTQTELTSSQDKARILREELSISSESKVATTERVEKLEALLGKVRTERDKYRMEAATQQRQLEEQESSFKKNKKQFTVALNAMHGNVTYLSDNIQTSKQNVQEFKENIISFMTELYTTVDSKLKATSNEYLDNVSTLEASKLALESSLNQQHESHLTQLKESHQSELDQLRQEHETERSTLQTKHAELQQKLEEFEISQKDRIAKKETELGSLQEKNQTLELQCDELEKEIATLRKEYHNKQDQHDTLQTTLKEIEGKNQLLSKAESTLTEENENLQTSVEQFRSRKIELEQQLSEQTTKNEELSVEIKELEAAVVDKQTELDELQKLSDSSFSELKIVKADLQMAEKASMEAQEALHKAQEKFDSNSTSQSQEIQSLQQNIDNLEISKSELQDTLAGLRDEFALLEGSLSNKNRLLEEASNQRQTLEQQIHELESTVEEQNNLLQKAAKDAEAAQRLHENEKDTLIVDKEREIQELQKSVDELLEFRTVHETANATTQERLAEMENELDVAHQNEINAKERLQSSKEVRSMLERELHTWKVYAAKAEGERAAAMQQLENSKETFQQAQTAIAEAETRVAQIGANCLHRLRRKNQAVYTFANEIASLKRDVRQLQQRNRVSEMMRQGNLVEKYSLRNGRAARRFLAVNATGTALGWRKASRSNEKQQSVERLSRFVDLSQVQSVVLGARSPVFQRVVVPPRNDRSCFSVYTKQRSYDFETSSETVAIDWVYGLRLLLLRVRGYDGNRFHRAQVRAEAIGLKIHSLARVAGYTAGHEHEYLRSLYIKAVRAVGTPKSLAAAQQRLWQSPTTMQNTQTSLSDSSIQPNLTGTQQTLTESQSQGSNQHLSSPHVEKSTTHTISVSATINQSPNTVETAKNNETYKVEEKEQEDAAADSDASDEELPPVPMPPHPRSIHTASNALQESEHNKPTTEHKTLQQTEQNKTATEQNKSTEQSGPQISGHNTTEHTAHSMIPTQKSQKAQSQISEQSTQQIEQDQVAEEKGHGSVKDRTRLYSKKNEATEIQPPLVRSSNPFMASKTVTEPFQRDSMDEVQNNSSDGTTTLCEINKPSIQSTVSEESASREQATSTTDREQTHSTIVREQIHSTSGMDQSDMMNKKVKHSTNSSLNPFESRPTNAPEIEKSKQDDQHINHSNEFNHASLSFHSKLSSNPIGSDERESCSHQDKTKSNTTNFELNKSNNKNKNNKSKLSRKNPFESGSEKDASKLKDTSGCKNPFDSSGAHNMSREDIAGTEDIVSDSTIPDSSLSIRKSKHTPSTRREDTPATTPDTTALVSESESETQALSPASTSLTHISKADSTTPKTTNNPFASNKFEKVKATPRPIMNPSQTLSPHVTTRIQKNHHGETHSLTFAGDIDSDTKNRKLHQKNPFDNFSPVPSTSLQTPEEIARALRQKGKSRRTRPLTHVGSRESV